MPAERVKILRDAFAKTMEDPEYLAKAARMKIELLHVNGEKLQKIIKEGVELEPEVRKKFKKTVFNAWGW